MSTINGVIFDYGGTIDTNGIHWGEVIAGQYRLAGIDIERELYRKAYVHGERSLAKAPIIAPEVIIVNRLTDFHLKKFAYIHGKQLLYVYKPLCNRL